MNGRICRPNGSVLPVRFGNGGIRQTVLEETGRAPREASGAAHAGVRAAWVRWDEDDSGPTRNHRVRDRFVPMATPWWTSGEREGPHVVCSEIGVRNGRRIDERVDVSVDEKRARQDEDGPGIKRTRTTDAGAPPRPAQPAPPVPPALLADVSMDPAPVLGPSRRPEPVVALPRPPSQPTPARVARPPVQSLPEYGPPRPPPEPVRILSDVQRGCDLDQIVEEKVMDAPVTLTLRQFLAACQAGHGGIPERLIGTIRRKRTVGAHAVRREDAPEELEAEHTEGAHFWNAVCYRSSILEAPNPDHAATEQLWARPVSETQIFVPGLDREVTALIDSGSEINLVERWVCEQAGWPMVPKPGWTIHTAVGRDEILAACPNVVLVVGNFASRHNLFVQDMIGYPLLLGQLGGLACVMRVCGGAMGQRWARLSLRTARR